MHGITLFWAGVGHGLGLAALALPRAAFGVAIYLGPTHVVHAHAHRTLHS